MSQKSGDVESGTENTWLSESDDSYIFDKKTRKDFIAKVYAILTMQLGISFAIIFGLNYDEDVREFTEDYFWIVFIFMNSGTEFPECRCPDEYCHSAGWGINRVPQSLICGPLVTFENKLFCAIVLLIVETLFFAGMATWISARYDLFVIWVAFLSTAVITLLVTVFAKFSPWDVTGCQMFILIGFLALLVFSIIALIVNRFMHAPLLYLIITGIGVLFLSFYLMFITQQILGGRKYEIEQDEVVLAVILLYTAIMEIFMFLLRLTGACFGEQ